MRKKKVAKSAEEFDRRFNEGEDIHDLIHKQIVLLTIQIIM